MAPETGTDPHVVAWLLTGGVKRQTLVKLAGRLGLTFPGTRLSTLPPDVIADALVDRWDEPDVRRAVVEVLNRSLPDERAGVARAGTDEEALKNLVREVIHASDPGRLDGLIWALAQSPHEVPRGLARGLIHSLEHMALHQEVSSAYAQVDDAESAHAEALTDLRVTRQELRRSERERDRLARSNADLSRRLVQATAELRAAASERKALQRELARLRRQLDEAREAVATRLAGAAELARLQEGLEAARQAEATWRARVDEVDAERRRLLADLEEMSRWLHRLPGRREDRDVRVAVFLDGENLLYSARAAFGERSQVSLSRILAAATRDRTLTEAVAYVGRLPVEGVWEPPQPTLADYQPPYRVRFQRPIKREGATWSGNWDVGIAVDILTRAGGVDAIALASGDGDFLPLLVYCRRHGIRTEVLAFPGSASSALALAADHYQELGPDVLWAAEEVSGSIPTR
ncbi:MAG: NYN domain-containing protein [Armatimonadota bacterium]|nr:NYN domain-containing protein [Armatimonadota bacterium]MDR7427668.1 NYN domain-containing protein [Armatimonadota bacterium]MDR7463720.1 NYN domain-containing protein [Armatimonadota bacterium]MDR7470187.1 NYN domain-containing protein [Armatimonadota bacterium]MDR7473615.1 NYN domain-containing protein [Armatimonadota bacterium]